MHARFSFQPDQSCSVSLNLEDDEQSLVMLTSCIGARSLSMLHGLNEGRILAAQWGPLQQLALQSMHSGEGVKSLITQAKENLIAEVRHDNFLCSVVDGGLSHAESSMNLEFSVRAGRGALAGLPVIYAQLVGYSLWQKFRGHPTVAHNLVVPLRLIEHLQAKDIDGRIVATCVNALATVSNYYANGRLGTLSPSFNECAKDAALWALSGLQSTQRT